MKELKYPSNLPWSKRAWLIQPGATLVIGGKKCTVKQVLKSLTHDLPPSFVLEEVD